MTLTGALPEDRRQTIRDGLASLYAPVAAPLAVDALCLFKQADRAGRFTILARFPFEG